MKCLRHTNPASRQSGFALVLALSIMAFALLLIMSMALLVQVETANSSTALNQLRAQQSARLALMMAIGDLQRYAGPDQRVTARAEILGTDTDGNQKYNDEAKNWTGIWDSIDVSIPLKWLVSGISANPAGTSTETMRLLGQGTLDTDNDPSIEQFPTHYINAPVIEVNGDSNTLNAKIAWWISDEGTKASLGGLPLNRKADPNFLEPESAETLQLQIAADHGLESLFGKYDRFTSNGALLLDRRPPIKQLLSQADFLEADSDFLDEAPFHALTSGSYGVLANTLAGTDGGLMQDLSLFPNLLGDGLEEYLQLGEENATALAALGSGVAGKRLFMALRGADDIGTLSDGDIAMPTAPILSNFMMAFTIRSESPVASNPNFYLRMRFFCEFWNPYTHSFRMNDNSGNDLNLELEITGLPEVTVYKTTGSLAQSTPINLQDLTAQAGHPDNAMIIRLVYDQNQPWLPGQTKNWTGIDASRATGASTYFSIDTTSKQWDDPDNNLGGSVGIDTLEPRLSGNIRHESVGSNNISVKVFTYNEADGTRTLLSELNDLVYDPVSTRTTGYGNTHSGTKFGYHFILRGPHFSGSDPEYFRGLWLHDHDPRNPRPSFNPDWHLDNDPSIPAGSPYTAVKDGIATMLIPKPEEIYDPGTINTVIFRRFMDRSSGNNGNLYNRLWQDAPLFELPRERILSLASLQHVYFHNERPFQVGNSWGAEGSENTSVWFDRYYFSGISRKDDINNLDINISPTNPALTYYDNQILIDNLVSWQIDPENDSTAARQPAEAFMVKNRFNLNSTSVAAWKTVLSSLRIHNYEYLDYPEDDTSNLSSLSVGNSSRVGSFARFSHSLEETYEAPQTPKFEDTDPVAPSAFYRHGARRFDDATFEQLAADIVNRLKTRGRPYENMEAFLSAQTGDTKSLLENAIATVLAADGRQKWDHEWETTGVKGPASEIIDIDHFSPGFLTQADVMTAIGPMLAPRSDTFKIRARGESFSELGQPVGNATIEAVIQRTPEVINYNTGNGESRRFKLLSIRWLSEDEI